MDRDRLLRLIDEAVREGYTELDLRDHGITELPSEIGRLTTLESLNLGHEPDASGEYNRLTTLPPEIGMLTALRSLDLNSNRLTTLPPEIGQLTALQTLDLSNNQLTILSSEIGQLTVLQSLDLSNNSLTGLPPEIGRLTTLQRLLLHQNQLTALPVEIGQLTALQEFSLSLDRMPDLPKMFGQLTALQALSLNLNLDLLTDLSTGISQLTALQSLALIVNQPEPLSIAEQLILASTNRAQVQELLPQEALPTLMTLQSLLRESDQPSDLPRGTDQPTVLPSPEIDSDDSTILTEFDLRLRSMLPEAALTTLMTLHSLVNELDQPSDFPVETNQPTVLTSPEIDSVDSHTSTKSDLRLWSMLPEAALPTLMDLQPLVKELDQPSDLSVKTDQPTVLPSPETNSDDSPTSAKSDLRLKQLTAIFSEISQLTALRRLFLGGNQLEVLPSEIGQLTTLQNLTLFQTNLTTLPPEIGQLTALQELMLLGNKQEALLSEIGQLYNSLRSPYETNLTALPSEIGQLNLLRVLVLLDTNLTALPPEIGQLTALQVLILQGNKLEALSPEISQLAALQHLMLLEEELESLPPEIGQLTALRVLSLMNTNLTTLPQEIGQLTALTELVLFGNNLEALPPEIGQLTTLQGLYLYEPNITTLPPEIEQLTVLKELYLSNSGVSTRLSGGSQMVDALLTNMQYLSFHKFNKPARPQEVDQPDTLLTQLRSVYPTETAQTALPAEIKPLMVLPPEIGRLTTLQSLVLSSDDLVTLPPEIGQLTALQFLAINGTHLTTLPPEIGQLTALQSLELSSDDLTTLPPEIGRLTVLTELYLSLKQLKALPPEIGRLTALKNLTLWGSELTVLPPEIRHLTVLTNLLLWNSKLTFLPPEIGQLTALRFLNLHSNCLTTLPLEIGQLTGLWSLDLSNNQLTALPPEIGQLTNLWSLDLRNNPGFPLPPEILEKTGDAQTIIHAYLDYLAGQTRPLNEVKLVFVGEGSVGKTSLVNRLLHDTFEANSDKTGGIAIHRWEIGCQSSVVGNQQNSESASKIEDQISKIRVNVWDFGGQEIMHATHQFFLTKRTLYVLVLDSRYSEAENRLDYWLTLIRSFGGDSPILVVGNKTDQHPLDLDRRGLLAKYPTVREPILETSCATGAGIADLRAAIAGQIAQMPHVADPVVNTWFEVKAQLEQTDADYIPYADYTRICREKSVDNPDSQRVLLGFLHDLGVVLHFPDPRLETTNILNPEWVTRGVYHILNTRLPFAEPGILTWDMLARILDDESYQEKRMFIVDMMQKFELCYELPDRKDTFLIPDLLPKEVPGTGAWDEALAFEVHYPVLPGSILTRLIVRMHRLIKDRTTWRAGVLLTCGNNEALVRADLSANRITIAVRGSGSGRRELLTRIRHELENIHSTIAGLRPEEKVPIPGHPEVKPVDYQHLRTLESLGEETFIPQGLAQRVSVRYLLDGVEPPEARRERDAKYEVHIHGGQVGVIGSDAYIEGGVHHGGSDDTAA